MRTIYKSRILSSGFLILVFLLSGCKKFLDIKPDEALSVPKSLPELQALLDNSTEMNVNSTSSIGTASADEYFFLDEDYFSLSDKYRTTYTWELVPYNHPNSWAYAYRPVFISNYCLDLLKTIEKKEANTKDWENVKGTALFFRSYNFLSLVWDFSKVYDKETSENDLGIVLRLGSDFNVPSKRASVEDTYQKIIADTKEALNLLPHPSITPMRPGKNAAYALLARTYLSMREYDSAYKYSDLSLKLKSDLIDFNDDEDINDIESNSPFKILNKEVIFHSEASSIDPMAIVFSGLVDTTLINLYPDSDLRKTAFFRKDNGYYKIKALYSGKENSFFSGLTTAEMLLIRAESSLRKGSEKEAEIDLNRLIRSRWNKDSSYTYKTFTDFHNYLQDILEERQKELGFRGLRWIDIKRLNKENFNIKLKRKVNEKEIILPPNSPYYALPIPQDIIEVTGIEQN